MLKINNPTLPKPHRKRLRETPDHNRTPPRIHRVLPSTLILFDGPPNLLFVSDDSVSDQVSPILRVTAAIPYAARFAPAFSQALLFIILTHRSKPRSCVDRCAFCFFHPRLLASLAPDTYGFYCPHWTRALLVIVHRLCAGGATASLTTSTRPLPEPKSAFWHCSRIITVVVRVGRSIAVVWRSHFPVSIVKPLSSKRSLGLKSPLTFVEVLSDAKIRRPAL